MLKVGAIKLVTNRRIDYKMRNFLHPFSTVVSYMIHSKNRIYRFSTDYNQIRNAS